MRWRGLSHIELSVPDYEASIRFYDRMFGWLGYNSFWTLDVGYLSTYYMPTVLFNHSYIGIQPARTDTRVDFSARDVGVHHVAICAKSRREIDRFHKEFLLKNDVTVTEAPAEYPVYAPGYYAVFFDDPVSGIHWEVAHTPWFPSPASVWRWKRAVKEGVGESHPEWRDEAFKRALRKLPRG
ncbi:hypothetical protein IMZ48_43960 [Candidatus Bathyarchaeota archaeon]|nr:hypothetical protein [Candidatus Bathyarchaeota archaeon]